MVLTPEEKAILFKPVHCTKYLTSVHGNYHLFHNEQDNNWYFIKDNMREDYAGKASENISSYVHNKKFELKDKHFEGVVVKVSQIVLSTILGVYDHTNILDTKFCACNYAPAKKKGCSITAATVFFRNGCKRILPLDCIKEFKGFSDGKETSRIMKNLDAFIESRSLNTISYKENGDIEIENSYYSFDYESAELLSLKRYLKLSVKNRKTTVIAEEGNEWFTIKDEEYQQIMDVMNKQIQEECGFVPDLSYGQTNYDRLVNFTNYPFAPEINEFSGLLNSNPRYKDDYKSQYAYIDEIENELKHTSDCVKKFIELFGLSYSSKLNKIFLQGHRRFAQYLAIWYTGIHNENSIESLIERDTEQIFATIIFNEARFKPYYIDEGFVKAGLWTIDRNSLFYDIRFLQKLYDEKTVTRLTKNILPESYNQGACYRTSDALDYLQKLYNENLLPEDIIKKVGKEGFTGYNHNLLMRLYRDTHPEPEEQYENKEITYSEEEKQLEWENGGYKFCLPEDTKRLVDIGSRMNICVGHLYRDKAVDKECTIVYAVKNNQYELCIEVSKHKDNRFHLVQRSAFNNSNPTGADMSAFRQWCRVKNIS